MKQAGLSIQAISELTGYDRKTVSKHRLKPETVPSYGPRAAQPSKLDAHKAYLEDRLKDGVWNTQVLLREIFEGLDAAVASGRDGHRSTPIRDTAGQTRAGGLATSGLSGSRRGAKPNMGLHDHVGLQPADVR